MIDRFLEGLPILFLIVSVMFAGMYVLGLVTIHQFFPVMFTAAFFNFIFMWLEERFL